MIFHVCSYHTDIYRCQSIHLRHLFLGPISAPYIALSCRVPDGPSKLGMTEMLHYATMRNQTYLSWQTLKHHRRVWSTRAKCLAQMRALTLPYLTSKCCVQHCMLDFRSAILKQCPTNDWSSATTSGPKLLLIECAYLVWMLHDLRSKSLRPCCPRVALAQESCWAKGCRGSSATPLSVSVQDHK